MARTAYCKRCGREVDAGEVCPFCGTRLGKNAAHVAWCAERTPVKDWMYWNSVMRLLLPGALAWNGCLLQRSCRYSGSCWRGCWRRFSWCCLRRGRNCPTL